MFYNPIRAKLAQKLVSLAPARLKKIKKLHPLNRRI